MLGIDLSNMRWEIVIVFMLAFLDIGLTYILLYKAKKSGMKNWEDCEQNKMVRFFLKKFGLHNGVRVAALFAFTMLTFLFGYFAMRVNWLDFTRLTFFMMGVYTIILTYHWMFLSQMDFQKMKESQDKKGDTNENL